MSDIAIGRTPRTGSAFRPATMIVLLAVGVLAFVAMLVLGAYAPDLRSGRNGGSHALSNAATGFSGLVALARATGRNPQVVRDPSMLDAEDLVVLTPETGATELGEVLGRRSAKPTLIVMPKWNTAADSKHAGWVRVEGLRPPFDPERTLAPSHPLRVERRKGQGRPLRTVDPDAPAELRFSAPGALQTIGSKELKPIVTDPDGRIVVAQVGDEPLYLLADPDLLSNHGIGDLRQAAAALALLDFLNSTGARSILFDVTLNGLGRSRSPLKLAFDPPFLATTLAIAAALLLAGVHAAARFGAPRRPERALAFGKAALIDNTAALVRKARRQAALGSRYADVIRERAARVFSAPPRLKDKALDAYLDQIGTSGRFSDLAAAAGEARHKDDLLAAARRLHRWQRENEG
ncbi:MAG: hypothetical protein JOZ90_01505 [Alphaproteobacteria bacterium]|nr:hypothetical protein [Alphaproteobacteria bacterium]MBV9370267.1 hypothetical protein [Alphaproteobacteria bacterium]MBV9899752.1 hypothetical protein [Alphaproteobacteria bacterium]